VEALAHLVEDLDQTDERRLRTAALHPLGPQEVSGLERSLAQLTQEIERHRQEVTDLRANRANLLTLEADELRQRGEEALRQGLASNGGEQARWFADARQDFRAAAEKNRYDCTVHFNLGWLCLQAQQDPQQAVVEFAEAVRHARRTSPLFCSYALRHLAHTHYTQAQTLAGADRDTALNAAREAAAQALSLHPGPLELAYEQARYSALTGHLEEALDLLRRIILADCNYCIDIVSEADFSGVREEVNQLFRELREEARQQAEQALAFAAEVWERVQAEGVDPAELTLMADRLENLRQQQARETYFDYLDIAAAARAQADHLVNAAEDRLRQEMRQLDQQGEATYHELSRLQADSGPSIRDRQAELAQSQQAPSGLVLFLGGGLTLLGAGLMLAALLSQIGPPQVLNLLLHLGLVVSMAGIPVTLAGYLATRQHRAAIGRSETALQTIIHEFESEQAHLRAALRRLDAHSRSVLDRIAALEKIRRRDPLHELGQT
jgi:regulator of replication initiation timing